MYNGSLVKEKPDVQGAIEAATELVRAGVIHYFIINCLVNDGFTREKAETIVRWAIMQTRNKV